MDAFTLNRNIHVMAVASAGGHWVQLMRLRPAWKGLDITYVSTDPQLKSLLVEETDTLDGRVPRFHAVTEGNRWQKHKLFKQLLQIFWIMLRVRPDVVITTGAAPGYFALRIGRAFGARTVWIDSIANTEELSLSGQRIGPLVDLWLTQWEHLAKPEGPQYIGAVL